MTAEPERSEPSRSQKEFVNAAAPTLGTRLRVVYLSHPSH